MTSTIYKIANTVTGDIYVGSSVNYKRRMRRHLEDLKSQKHHCIPLQRAFLKYGRDTFLFEIIEQQPFVDKQSLLAREQHYINALKPVYNIQKIAGSQLGLRRSDEFRKQCSERNKGKKPWNAGLKTGPQSEQHKANRATSMTGHVVSEETKAKLSKAHTGKKLTEDHRRKLSKVKIKHGRYLYDKPGVHYTGE